MVDHFFFTYTNLRRRDEHSQRRVASLLDKLKTAAPITTEEKAQVERWQTGSARLRNALLHVDDHLMLFRDFRF